MRKVYFLSVAVVLLILIAPGPAPATPPKVIEFVMGTTWVKDSSIGAAQVAWAEELEKRTNGQMKVGQMTWAGAVAAPATVYELLGKGVIDLAGLTPLYSPSNFQLSIALAPLFLNQGQGIYELQGELLKRIPEVEAECAKMNIKVVAWFHPSTTPLTTNFTFDSMDGLKAKRIRTLGPMTDMVKAWGGVPLAVSTANMYTAMQKGTVDGVTSCPLSYVEGMRLYEVAKQITDFRFGLYTMWTALGMNLDKWNSLTDSQKKVINEIAPVLAAVNKEGEYKQGMDALKHARERGVKIVLLSPEEAEAWQRVANPEALWDKSLAGAEQAGYKDVWKYKDMIKNFLTDYEKSHPYKSLVEEFLELEKQGKQ